MHPNYDDDSADSARYWAQREARLQAGITGATAATPTPAAPQSQVIFYKKSKMEDRAKELYDIAANALDKIKAQPEQTRTIASASKAQLANKVKLIEQSTDGDKKDRLELADHVDAMLGVCADFGTFDSILQGALDHVKQRAEAM